MDSPSNLANIENYDADPDWVSFLSGPNRFRYSSVSGSSPVMDSLSNLANIENSDADPDWVSYLRDEEEFLSVENLDTEPDPDWVRFLSRQRNEDESYSDFGENRGVAASSVLQGLVEVTIGKENKGFCCAVCIEEFEPGEKVKGLPCSHYYHGDCIIPWLRMRNTCPLCVYELPTERQGGSTAATASGGGGGSR